MRRWGLIFLSIFISLGMQAQSFATRYMAEYADDTLLTNINVSPRMMKEILNINEQLVDSTGMIDIISTLNSMQLVTAEDKGETYFEEAEEIAKRNSGRFEEMVAYNKKGEHCRIYIRRQGELIMELVMIHRQGKRFMVIDFTGEMSMETIEKLAHIILPSQPEAS